MKIAMVEWVDSCSWTSWRTPDILDTAKISRCVSVGMMTEREKDYLLTQSLDNSCGNIDNVMSIPKCAVTRIRYLKVK